MQDFNQTIYYKSTDVFAIFITNQSLTSSLDHQWLEQLVPRKLVIILLSFIGH